MSRELRKRFVRTFSNDEIVKFEGNFETMITKLLESESAQAKFPAKPAALLLVVAVGAFLLFAHEFRQDNPADKFTEAAASGNIPQVLALLDQGVELGAQDSKGKTALGRASFQGQRNMVELLLIRGADANARGRYGKTALMAASSQGHLEIARTLVSNGTEINAQDEYNQTALMCASLKGHKEVVKIAPCERGRREHEIEERVYRAQHSDGSRTQRSGGTYS
jgi:hypothetical protein